MMPTKDTSPGDFADNIRSEILQQERAPETDTPIELPVTMLGTVAALLREVQMENMVPLQLLGDGPMALTDRQLSINDKLTQAGILVDMVRGDGQ